jgi:hypothetical protein
VLIGFAAGLLILAPSLAYLFRLVLSGRFDPARAPWPEPGTFGAGAAAAKADRGAHSAIRTTLVTGGLTALGAAVTFVSDAPLRGFGVALMIGGAVACFLAVASLDEGDTPTLPFPTTDE